MNDTNSTHSEAKPNVVLICVDQWRGDCLSYAGHPDVDTPYLDQLAANGALARQAYAAAPTCVPARMSLMTGLSPQTHRRIGYQDGVEFDIAHTLPRTLHNAGYQTQAIGKMHYWPERGRIGFDDVLLHDGYLHYSRNRERDPAWYDDYLTWLRDQHGMNAVEDYISHGVECNSIVARPWDKPEHTHPTNWVITEATRWLYRRDPTSPFFLYLSFHRPHAPYDPPPWAFHQYDTGQLHQPAVGNWSDDLYRNERRNWDPTAHAATYRPRQIQRAMAGYYGHMTHIDGQISRFLQTLHEFAVADRTYVIFVSDHGDMMGDHHLWRKGYPYEGSAKIPLILSGPGIHAGTTIDQIVELRDLMPTILDLVGVQIPEGVEGRSLLPFLTDTDQPDASTNAANWRDYLHGEHVLFGQHLHWIRFAHYKYVWFSQWGHEQLFNLRLDPRELNDLCSAARDTPDEHALNTARSYLLEALKDRPEGFVSQGKLQARSRPASSVLPRPYPPAPRAR